jgi:hypothetical protein
MALMRRERNVANVGVVDRAPADQQIYEAGGPIEAGTATGRLSG